MSDTWIVVIVVGVGAVMFKAAGPVVVGGRQLPRRVDSVVANLAPALIAAFIATQVFGGDRQLVLDERALGIAAAGLLLVFRAPALAVVFGAAAITAAARALG